MAAGAVAWVDLHLVGLLAGLQSVLHMSIACLL